MTSQHKLFFEGKWRELILCSFLRISFFSWPNLCVTSSLSTSFMYSSTAQWKFQNFLWFVIISSRGWSAQLGGWNVEGNTFFIQFITSTLFRLGVAFVPPQHLYSNWHRKVKLLSLKILSDGFGKFALKCRDNLKFTSLKVLCYRFWCWFKLRELMVWKKLSS